jgi:hypothetical protein
MGQITSSISAFQQVSTPPAAAIRISARVSGASATFRCKLTFVGTANDPPEQADKLTG